ncbi:hypothetical protein [Legionella cincinnatiensis]|uniref:Uncharacterized protein n=1 Tax=Legionella cincinnatiensis TaxID=28085 RepID=A0A378IKX9_9GAMM|nr:hypothetical protein [Legionella cincinnatiensis]KTC93945.1 hypothetical protein Lcin_0033 [Legionella cincinnatiensis]STX35151.1 Uncharacterised protein [Legionella cincinnatiensis]
MGNTSSFEKSIEKQEAYVNKRMKDPDMSHLKHGFFRDGHEKYSNRQVKGYLRQEYHNTRRPDSYVSDHDLHASKKYRMS